MFMKRWMLWAIIVSHAVVMFAQSLVPIPGAVASPQHNPTTAAKVELGKKLFFDPRLSGDNKMSCAYLSRARQGIRGWAGPVTRCRRQAAGAEYAELPERGFL